MNRDAPDLQYVGEWWLPSNPTSRARGTLVVSAGEQTTLSLEPGESLGPMPDDGSPIVDEFAIHLRETYPVVLGEAYEIAPDKREHQRRCLTLTKCYARSGSSSQNQSVLYSIEVVIAGEAHVPSPRFNELQFDIPNLAKTFPYSAFEPSAYYPVLAQPYSPPDDLKPPFPSSIPPTQVLGFRIIGVAQRWLLKYGVWTRRSKQSNMEIRFVHDIVTGHPPSCTTSLTDRYRLIVRWRSQKLAWISIEPVQWFWEEFSQFFWLVTGVRPVCRQVMAATNDSSRVATFQIYSRRMVDGPASSSDMLPNPDPWEHALFFVGQITSRDIRSLWFYWDALYPDMSDVLLLRGIGRRLSHRGHQDEPLLLDVAALESLYRRWVPHSPRRNSVKKKGDRTGNPVLLVYVTRLAYQYVPELKSHAEALSLAASDYRNYVAHHSDVAEKSYRRWPQALMWRIPEFCDFLLDMTILDFVGSTDWRAFPNTSDQMRMAKKYAAHPEHARLVHYIVRIMDEWSSKSSETG